MNNLKHALFGFLVLCGTWFILPVTQAAEVNVTWTHPEKYRDIYAGGQNRKHFRESTFKSLEKHFLKLAQALPKAQTLEIEVLDLDLAGDVHSGGIRQIRIIKDLFFPRIKFTFKLINADKVVVHRGEENIKDMNFMMNSSLKYRNRALSHEKKLLDDWFKRTFENYVTR